MNPATSPGPLPGAAPAMAKAARDDRIDFLRFTGLMMVMLAHVYPPAWLAQLRNFDVPLMVLVSALSFSASYRNESYGQYVWARVKRLVFPVWLFLSLLFLLQWGWQVPIDLPSGEKIVRSYLLLDGIGYVWVIRVFLLVALIAPFLYRYHLRQQSDALYWRVLALWYLAYEALMALLVPALSGPLRALMLNTVFFLWPYALVFALGLRVPALARGSLWRLFALAAAAFLAMGGWLYLQQDGFVRTQLFKYPPQHYYLAYALMCAMLLWLFASQLLALFARLHLRALVLFAGSNSIWIYLWHIFYVQLWQAQSWGTEYLLICSAAMLTTWLQVRAVSALLTRLQSAPLKKNLRTLLTG